MAKDFIIVTDKGLIAPNAKEPTEVMAQLMYAYLELWNDEMFEIDVVDAAEKIVALLGSMRPKYDEDQTLENALGLSRQELEDLLSKYARLFADYLCGLVDEDEGNG